MNRAGRLSEEAGFTLVEVLVSTTMMFAVLFALYGIFDTSVRVFGYGGDRIEAVGDARLALSRMEREIRGAYPYDPTSDPPRRYLLLDPLNPTTPAVPTATRIAFGNETGGDRRIGTSEVIGYYLAGHDLKRSKGGSDQCRKVRLHGVLGSTHGPAPMLKIPTDVSCALLEQALRAEATGAAGSATFRQDVLTSREVPCRRAQAEAYRNAC